MNNTVIESVTCVLKKVWQSALRAISAKHQMDMGYSLLTTLLKVQ